MSKGSYWFDIDKTMTVLLTCQSTNALRLLTCRRCVVFVVVFILCSQSWHNLTFGLQLWLYLQFSQCDAIYRSDDLQNNINNLTNPSFCWIVIPCLSRTAISVICWNKTHWLSARQNKKKLHMLFLLGLETRS